MKANELLDKEKELLISKRNEVVEHINSYIYVENFKDGKIVIDCSTFLPSDIDALHKDFDFYFSHYFQHGYIFSVITKVGLLSSVKDVIELKITSLQNPLTVVKFYLKYLWIKLWA